MQKEKPLAYRLALDLGSTSLGWAVLRLSAPGEPSAIIKAGVRIFSDGRNPKDGSSLAVTRRAARAMRRRRDRLLKRKARMLAALERHGFFPQDEAARKALETRATGSRCAAGTAPHKTPRTDPPAAARSSSVRSRATGAPVQTVRD